MLIANFAIKRPIYNAFSFIHYSATYQARGIKFGNKYDSMDFYTNSAFQILKVRNFVTVITIEGKELSA